MTFNLFFPWYIGMAGVHIPGNMPGLSEPALLSGRVPFGPTTNGGNAITTHVRTLSRSFKF